jgi:hypothetical protein
MTVALVVAASCLIAGALLLWAGVSVRHKMRWPMLAAGAVLVLIGLSALFG